MITSKNKSQIKIMKIGGAILKNILDQIAAEIKPGQTCQFLEELAKKLINAAGGKPSFYKYQGFPAAICTSINDEIVHGIPKKRVLKSGDIISIDIGLKYKGYHTDSAITVPVGKVEPKHLKLIRVAKIALTKAIAQVKPKNHISDIGYIIQKTIEKAGFEPVRECTGHGIGKKLHEAPPIPNFGKAGQGPEIKPGMTFAIEPMTVEGKAGAKTKNDGWTISTTDGGFAAHFEHTVAVTEEGCLVLTA